MKRALCVLCIVLVASFLLVFPDSTVFAQTILFEDDFNDGNSDGWLVSGTPSNWSVINNEYGIYVGNGLTNSVPSDSIWGAPKSEYIFEIDLRGEVGVDKNIIIKYKDDSDFYEIHFNGQKIYFERHRPAAAGGQYVIGSVEYILNNHQTYRFTSVVKEHHYQIYVTSLGKTTLLFDVTDPNPSYSGGKIGVRVGTGSAGPSEVWYDNVLVKPIVSGYFLDVPNLKQFSEPWNSDIYDNSPRWSTLHSIETWGCALVSATMVLKYHGYDIDPSGLNDWLIEQPDGYIKNGLLNWLAIPRFTLDKKTSDTPVLEYLFHNRSNSVLEAEITLQRPPIVKLPGHFVVATGVSDSKFTINDPASWVDKLSTLESERGNYTAMHTFIPSFTDLSYIMLVLDKNFDVKILKDNGEEIELRKYTDDQLLDYPSKSLQSGSPVFIFQLQKPEAGEYKVYVYGEGIYNLDSYLYSPEGVPTITNLAGLSSQEKPDELTITIGEGNSIDPTVNIKTIIENLDNSYKLGLILNKRVYRNLRLQLLFVKHLIKTGRNKSKRVILWSISKQIKTYTPRYIHPEAAKIILSEINLLKNKK